MSKVVIQECKDYNVDLLMRKINDGIERIGGWDSFVKKRDKVLLKINLIGPKTPESAAITHPEFVRAITRILKNKGCEVWIGDSSGGAIAGVSPTTRSFKIGGYEKVAEEEGAVIKNFDSEGAVPINPESKLEETMYLAKPLFDADVVINLPKLKTHSAAFFTGAVKNVFGCIPGLRKAKYHKIAPDPAGFGEYICDIHRGAKFTLHIMDGITAMQGEGPTAGTPYSANKILISTDPLALDTSAARMLKMEVKDIPILHTAEKRKLGESNLENIIIDGDHNKVPELDGFKMPKRFKSSRQGNNKAVIKVIDFFKARPRVDLKKCKNCNMCVESCPVQAINRDTKSINYNLCIECMCCHELCMYKAVDVKNDNIVAGAISRFFK